MEHARARGETAIGYLSGDGPLHLAPPALQKHTYEDDDRIIVVSIDGASILVDGASMLIDTVTTLLQ